MQVISAPRTKRASHGSLEVFNLTTSKELAGISQRAYNSYLSFVRSYVRSFAITDQEQADTIAIDAYCKVIKHFDPTRFGHGGLAGFFKRVIRNCVIDSERRRRHRSKDHRSIELYDSEIDRAGALCSSEPDPAVAAQSNELGDIIYSTVATLRDPRLKRIGLTMLTRRTGSSKEIAAASGYCIAYVKVLTARLRQILLPRVSESE